MENRKSIGGFLGLEMPLYEEYHKDAVKLNSGRNSLEYILRVNEYKKIYIPYYSCDAILIPINNLNIPYEFYSIDQKLEPLFELNQLSVNEAFLYTNYLGLKTNYIVNNLSHFENIIIDNAQAFFSEPIKNLDSFYSPRKFFGVSDGGYVYTNKKKHITLEESQSYNRVTHLVKQVDLTIESAYQDYLINEEYLKSVPLKQMSNLTKNLLQAIDYDFVSKRRIDNFNYLKNQLQEINRLDIGDIKEPPLHYPLLLNVSCNEVRNELIENKIYCPKYWENVLNWIPEEKCFEAELVNNMLHLPIDQRYNLTDMEYIVRTYKEIIMTEQ